MSIQTGYYLGGDEGEQGKNPFRWEDTDERAKLRATPHAIASFICNEKSPVKQGEMLGKGLYSHTP
jgi:hypothetical protein